MISSLDQDRAPRERWAPAQPDLVDAFLSAPTALAVTTRAGTIAAANTALGRLLRRDAASLIGATFAEMTHPDDVAGAARADAVLPAGGWIVRDERRFVVGDRGRIIWVSLSAARLPRAPGRPVHLVVHVDDITRRRQHERELTHRALHDPLTGLANRALLTERITAAIAQLGRHARPSHVFYLDLNGFKGLNDRYGHAAGDAVLVEFAERITGLLRIGDTAGRLGGDEFAVLCQDADPCVADIITARLRAAAARPFSVNGIDGVDATAVTLSAAVGDCPVRIGRDPADLLHEADQRMYETKRRDQTRRPTTEESDPVPAPEPTFADIMGAYGMTRIKRRHGRRLSGRVPWPWSP